ncbi:hypothetical protein BYT27DRAFT_7192804 [Phlegmacium glaucopus]|nr:hypothetical protein BYT27DRAFT_7192804 [Phlegmacium glaucopus]
MTTRLPGDTPSFISQSDRSEVSKEPQARTGYNDNIVSTHLQTMTTPNASGSSTASLRGTQISGSVFFHFDFSKLHQKLSQLEIAIAATNY